MDSPFVSVVIATYRREESLRKALISLASQTYANFEIVVVDDNNNQEWNQKVRCTIEELQQDFSNVKLRGIVNTANMGSAIARNIGIENSIGQYITFLDDDDVYLPNKIETQIKGMIDNGADFSLTDLYLYNENDKLIDKRNRKYLMNCGEKELMECHLKYHMTGTDTFMFKRDYLLSIGCFEPIDVGDEFYLMQKAIQGGGKLHYQPECHVKAYVHTGEGSLSSGQGKIDGENQLYLFKKQFFEQISSKSRKYIQMRHYAVLAFAELRMKKIFSAVRYGGMSFMCAPIQCLRMCLERKI